MSLSEEVGWHEGLRILQESEALWEKWERERLCEQGSLEATAAVTRGGKTARSESCLVVALFC